MPRKKNPHCTPYVKPDYHSGNKKKNNNDMNKNEKQRKKIKLRSSLDIYNRLIHDKTLNINLNNVNIGYSDHVLGNQEMCILDWKMVDKGGDIPMHHILYFVFILNNGNKIILWDRQLKLDRLYCSGTTIKKTESLEAIIQLEQNIMEEDKVYKNKPSIAFDIDGTIVDIQDRLSLVPITKTIMNGENYNKYDRVIPVALAYLKYIESTNKYNIIYLSGRKSNDINYSKKWLFELNDYPKGLIIHRNKGMILQNYKQQQLQKLKTTANVIAYFGDTIHDCIASINAGVRPIMVVPDQWLFTKQIYGGIGCVINEYHNDSKQSFIDTAKRSVYWGMAYKDLIPIQFTTELFHDNNQNCLPHAVVLKLKDDKYYLKNILIQTKQILENENNTKNENGMQVATIDNEEKKQDLNNTKMAKEIFVDDEIIRKFFPRYPASNDGFAESFDLNDTDKWIKYLNHYGLVVLKVLTEKEADKTINSMFDEVYARKLKLTKTQNEEICINRVDMNNPLTWHSDNFPKPFGRLTDRPAFSKQAFKNRCSQKMHNIWSTIFGTDNLNVSIEHWGIQRGTVNLKFVDPKTNEIIDEVKEEVRWRRNLRPHWDVNPWTYSDNIESKHWINLYQGALALSEQRLIDGTHLTLPGCARFLKKWCQENRIKDEHEPKHNISFDDGIIKYMQAIPLRKGEMVIWNFGQLHANTKNMSDRMRLSQYMRMIPSKQKYIQRDAQSVQQQMEKYKNDVNIEEIMGENEMDDRIKKLLGLKEW